MNEEEAVKPKKGIFASYEKFPRYGDFSFSLGFAKEPHHYCLDGYDNPITHSGFETYFYIIIYNRQFAIGYRSVKKVK